MTASQFPLGIKPHTPSREWHEKNPLEVSEVEIVSTPPSGDLGDRYLVVSPYTEQEHMLDLETLDAENQLLALALTSLKCVRDDYATGLYLEIFNWADVIETLRALACQRNHAWRKTSFYVVAFRSQIPPTTVYADLGVLDKGAHIEATASGGFLKYVNIFLFFFFHFFWGFRRAMQPLLLTLAADIGLEPPILKDGISRRASGDRKKTRGREAPAPPTARQPVPLDTCTRSGESIAIG